MYKFLSQRFAEFFFPQNDDNLYDNIYATNIFNYNRYNRDDVMYPSLLFDSVKNKICSIVINSVIRVKSESSVEVSLND